MAAIGMSKIFEFPENKILIQTLSDRIVSVLKIDIEDHGNAIFAVSGGSSPKALFAHLRNNQSLDWSKVTIVLVDERWVPDTHADSNEMMVQENLLQDHAAKAEFIGWTSSADNLNGAVNKANARFKQLTLPFSVVILGMGVDGHTASWFFDAPEYDVLIDTTQAAAVCAAQPDKAPHARLTLNYSALIQTRAMFLQINGKEKKDTLYKAFSGDDKHEYPISHLLNENSPLEIYWSLT